MTIDGLIVTGSIAFSLAFGWAWLRRPALRGWLEAPKYGFQAAVERYDRECRETTERSATR